MSQIAVQSSSYRRPYSLVREQASADPGWLLVELLRVLRPSGPDGDVSAATSKAAPLLAELLNIHGRPWPVLQVPDRLAIEVVIRNDSVQIRVEPTDGFESVLAVRFDYTGRLLTWKSWSNPRSPQSVAGYC